MARRTEYWQGGRKAGYILFAPRIAPCIIACNSGCISIDYNQREWALSVPTQHHGSTVAAP